MLKNWNFQSHKVWPFTPQPCSILITLFQHTKLWMLPACALGFHTCVSLHLLSFLRMSFLLVYPGIYFPFIGWLCDAFPDSLQTFLPASARPLHYMLTFIRAIFINVENSVRWSQMEFSPTWVHSLSRTSWLFLKWGWSEHLPYCEERSSDISNFRKSPICVYHSYHVGL